MLDDAKISMAEITNGIPAFKLFAMTHLCNSSSVARRLICQGGAYVNRVRVEKFDQRIGPEVVVNQEILLRAGKKRYYRLKVTT